jgi:hypothetical protein
MQKLLNLKTEYVPGNRLYGSAYLAVFKGGSGICYRLDGIRCFVGVCLGHVIGVHFQMLDKGEIFEAGYIQFDFVGILPVTVDNEYGKLAFFLVVSGSSIDMKLVTKDKIFTLFSST